MQRKRAWLDNDIQHNMCNYINKLDIPASGIKVCINEIKRNEHTQKRKKRRLSEIWSTGFPCIFVFKCLTQFSIAVSYLL